MSTKTINRSISRTTEEGDLGLGRGLKPGALPREELDDTFDDFTNLPRPRPPTAPISSEIHAARARSSLAGQTRPREEESDKGPVGRFSERFRRLRKSKSEDIIPSEGVCGDAGAPIFAEVPLGTSLRQQRQLFEQELQELVQKNSAFICIGDSPIDLPNGISLTNSKPLKKDKSFVQRKLKQAHQEIDILKQDLELCQKQLEAKYQAIKILQKQAFLSQHEQSCSIKKSSSIKNQLQQELGQLQFEMEYRQSCFMDSQQTWAQRYDRMCQENGALMGTLEARSDEMRRLHAEKIIVVRERDELLALLDIQERERYESLKSISSEDAYQDYTSLELSIMGACQCRVQSPDPCGCAHAAVVLKRQVWRIQDEYQNMKQKKTEAEILSDAYRIAFEEQLSHNRNLVQQLVQLTTTGHRLKGAEKVKAILSWLIHQLNEDLPVPPRSFQTTGTEDVPAPPEDRTEDELLNVLVDMISDKTEALAHQKLTSRMLASRTRELEDKLTSREEIFGSQTDLTSQADLTLDYCSARSSVSSAAGSLNDSLPAVIDTGNISDREVSPRCSGCVEYPAQIIMQENGLDDSVLDDHVPLVKKQPNGRKRSDSSDERIAWR